MKAEKKISLTDAALKRILEITGNAECLSITVEPGGCNGFEYKFEVKRCDNRVLCPSQNILEENGTLNTFDPITHEQNIISKHGMEAAQSIMSCSQHKNEAHSDQNSAGAAQDEMIHTSKEGKYYVTWNGRIILEIDNTSLELMCSAQLDYVRELVGEKFVIKNPNSQSTCSCGNSFGI
ncbi:iron-sulfur cluster assembly accessory protein [Neorickettsia findlayensis]|uniref:Iron-sulfur cluster assembly accessory protein n=1 Tax=Neorickettsia findlayensis TaxID=2686014 RepID=A0A6P1GA53_9RICK|nr:iron-sulfur cluster assembly accessory protein [Neorickettsia findlayensis]QHD65188.1 iron-sulfur cluster assembly accessory protein [Neorickettsia findlayensis]